MLIKLSSTVVVILLLFPIAKIFFDMVFDYRHEPTRNEMVSDGTSGMTISKSNTVYSYDPVTGDEAIPPYLIQSPFSWSQSFFEIGPRKWVGLIGMTTTAATFLLLLFSILLYPNSEGHTSTTVEPHLNLMVE